MNRNRKDIMNLREKWLRTENTVDAVQEKLRALARYLKIEFEMCPYIEVKKKKKEKK